MPERIAPLAREVVERIAAGEVIERPASVARELIANALDARATAIRIELRDGGLRLLRVSDDGEGMLPDDLPLAVTPHATSKLHCLADLEQVTTLGFRGEALASIAAVAEIEIVSAADTTGSASALRIGPEASLTLSSASRMCGVTVTVRELFTAVPARRALLRSARVEARRALDVARGYALAHPQVRFTVISDGAVVLQTPGMGRTEGIAAIYGSDVARALLSLDATRVGDSAIGGVVASRAFHTAARDHVLLVVNGRPVANRALLGALEAGYRPLLRKGRHPLLVVEVTTPADQVDANIHPSKLEVLLRNERALIPVLREAVHTALGRAPLNALAGAPDMSDLTGGRFVRPAPLRFPPRRTRRLPRLAERGRHYTVGGDDIVGETDEGGEWEPLAQFDETLILARANAGHLLLVDQHRAHERILYERLRQRRDALRLSGAAFADFAGEDSAQLLLQPLLVELSPLQARQLEPRLDELRALGLDCQPFGDSVFLVRSAPHLPGMAYDAAAIAATLVEDAATDSEDWLDVVCVTLACRTAIRRGQSLTVEEQRALLADLRAVKVVASCPHGSPLLLRYSHSGLARIFQW